MNDLASLRAALNEISPEAVISLLITLPRWGPVRVGDFKATMGLWRQAVPNLIAAAEDAGAQRLVAESVIFAYGYERGHDEPWREDDPPGAGVLAGHDELLSALRGMERRVTDADGLDGIVLRYGLLHGAGVPSTQMMARGLRWRLPLIPGAGEGLHSWVELGDAAVATVAALERGRPGQVYNIVDDEPIRFAAYARELARAVGAPRPRSAPRRLAQLAAPHATVMLDHTEVPVSNQKARRELDWERLYPTPVAAVRGLASCPNPAEGA